VRFFVNRLVAYFVGVLKNSTVDVFCAKVATALKEERERQKLSMSSLAERAGLSQQMVSYVERGMRKPTLDTIYRMSVALEMDLSALIRKALKS
jgi:transcriptional regulator with XRE-family HTH domain